PFPFFSYLCATILQSRIMATANAPSILPRVRRWIFWIFLLTTAGLGAELFLLEHTEGFWQLFPFILMTTSTIALLAHAWMRNRTTMYLLRGMAVALVIGGTWGLWMHYHGNAEFELEMYPKRGGFELFWEALKGATPVLAPGAVIGLGLLAWAYTLFPNVSPTDTNP
ncbi:MAG: hypothetical protein AAF570_26765, partial [Bacteroidota bacterium]